MNNNLKYQVLHSRVFNKKTVYFVKLINKDKYYILFDGGHDVYISLLNNKEYLKILNENEKNIKYKIYDNKDIKKFYFHKTNMIYSIRYNSDQNNIIFNFEIPKFRFLQKKFENINFIAMFEK